MGSFKGSVSKLARGRLKTGLVIIVGLFLVILGVGIFLGFLGYSVWFMFLGLPLTLMGIALLFAFVRRQEPSEGEDVSTMWQGRYPPLGRAPEEKEPTD